MSKVIKKLLIKAMKDIIKKLEDDKCEMTEEEANHFMSAITHEPLSKEQACDYLNVSRATFDNYIRNGYLPKGKKRKGFNELVWYKDEISNPFKS